MAKRDPKLLVSDMLEAAERIMEYIAHHDEFSFASSQMVVDAVVRNLEIIGEAANRIPSELKLKHDHIPWRRLVGLRHRIVHEYFGIDIGIVWAILTTDLQPLIDQLKLLVQTDLE